MIPYFEQPVLRLGALSIHAFGVCAAAALATGYVLVRRRAERFGSTPKIAARLYLASVFSGLAAGWLWSAFEPMRGISGTGLGLGGLIGLVAGVRLARAPLWPALDEFAAALVTVMAIARVGCFLAHDHIGKPTDAWLGVAFPGGGRWDLGLVYALSSAATAAVLIALRRRGLAPGVVAAAAIVLLGASRAAALPLGESAPVDYALALLAMGCGVVIAGRLFRLSPVHSGQDELHVRLP
jgi:phosphatidylglycerol---prolipoprotein diacylglyceryl transferase